MRSHNRYAQHRSTIVVGLCIAICALLVVPESAIVLAADTERHSGPAMEQWVEDQIVATTVSVDQYTTVTVDQTNNRLIVEDFTFSCRGVSFGVSEVRIDFGMGTDVELAVELDIAAGK